MCAMTDEAGKIAIVTHMHPDGDAIGSSVGLLLYLQSAGKETRLVLNDNCPESLAFLTSGLEDRIISYEVSHEKALEAIRESDLIFCLDMNSFGRAENLEGYRLLRSRIFGNRNIIHIGIRLPHSYRDTVCRRRSWETPCQGGGSPAGWNDY